jgi:DNA-binding CsgD family transcriptional regulator
MGDKTVSGATHSAFEIIQSQTSGESIYTRIGKALTSIIPSDVSAIEVFDRNGDYAERCWSNADRQISRHFDCFLAHRFEHPLFKEFVISGLRNPVRISDCRDFREFPASGMFNEFFKPLGISTQMAVALPSDSIGLPVLAIARAKRDFSATERKLVCELMPRIRRQIAAERTWGHYDLLMNQLLQTNAAVALIAFHAFVIHSTPRFSDLLDRYFPDDSRSRHQLPRHLARLLQGHLRNVSSEHSFASQDSHSSLRVTICNSQNGDQQILLLQESVCPHKKLSSPLALSPRLVDILLLVEKGYSNKEIAVHLELSPNTVRTQVEQLLHKLNASNRTQAASLARKHLDGIE